MSTTLTDQQIRLTLRHVVDEARAKLQTHTLDRLAAVLADGEPETDPEAERGWAREVTRATIALRRAGVSAYATATDEHAASLETRIGWLAADRDTARAERDKARADLGEAIAECDTLRGVRDALRVRLRREIGAKVNAVLDENGVPPGDSIGARVRAVVAELAEVRAERDAAIAERDAWKATHGLACDQRDAALDQRDAAHEERVAAIAERDTAIAERDEARTALANVKESHAITRQTVRDTRAERDVIADERDDARLWRDRYRARCNEAREQRDKAIAQLAKVRAERDSAIDAAIAERDAARAELAEVTRQRDRLALMFKSGDATALHRLLDAAGVSKHIGAHDRVQRVIDRVQRVIAARDRYRVDGHRYRAERDAARTLHEVDLAELKQVKADLADRDRRLIRMTKAASKLIADRDHAERVAKEHLAERDAARVELAELHSAHNDAMNARIARDTAHAKRDAAIAERDKARAERDAAMRNLKRLASDRAEGAACE